MTNKIQEKAESYFRQIEEMGGVVAGIEKGFFQQEIARAAFVYQKEIDAKERIIVGVNDFVDEEEKIEIPILSIPEEVEKSQIKRLQETKRTRNNRKVSESLRKLKNAALNNENLMPYLIESAKEYCSIGEMVDTLKEVFGEYTENAEF